MGLEVMVGTVVICVVLTWILGVLANFRAPEISLKALQKLMYLAINIPWV
jgi:hypothetical protein